MRCLTIQPPWAWAIFYGKTIENRAQLWSYRGPLAIHAGARWSARGGASDLVHRAWKNATTDCSVAEYGHTSQLWTARGEILGLVDLVDVHPDAHCCRPWGESVYVEHGGRERRHITHLVLENPRPLDEPIPCRGALGLWSPPPDVEQRLEALLTDISPTTSVHAKAIGSPEAEGETA